MKKTAILGAGLLLVLAAACSGSSGAALEQAALEGDYVAGGLLADSPQAAPYGEGLVLRFDGAGNATWPGVGKAFPDFRYGDHRNGNVTLDGDVAGILSQDGEIMILASAAGGFGPEFWGAVKVLPGAQTAMWRGEYVGFALGARDGGPCWLDTVRLAPDGAGTVVSTVYGRSDEATCEYGIRDGILSMIGSPVDGSDDHTTGALTSDGLVVVLTDIDPLDRGVVIAIKKSTTGAANAWNGTYECFQFGLDTAGPVADCWTARVTLTADGGGRYTYRAVDTAGFVETGAGTYVQKSDGTLAIDFGLQGMISSDGETVLLGLEAGGEMSLIFGVRR